MLFPFLSHSATPHTRAHPGCNVRLTQGLLAGLVALISLNAGAQALPPEVEALLARAKVPREAFAAVVVDAAPALNGRAAPLLSHRAGSAMNPASVMKLVTTYAGLELLGPAYTWATPVYTDGPVIDGVLNGNLIIQGRGDPKLVMERLWLLLRRVQGLGIQRISGDIVLDRSAFAASTQNPGDFDGEALRPYNVQPDALLVNYKSVVMSFAPSPGSGSASISYDPPLAGVRMQASVPLSAGSNGRAALGDCGDYRAQLQPDLTDPLRMAFAGSYPAACGEKVWAIAYPDPAGYAARAIAGLWQEMGGRLDGRVREGAAPPRLAPAFEMLSPSLAEVIRDINKFSNNVMAQQLFLTLSLQRPGGASNEASREAVRGWWLARFGRADGGEDGPVLDNGSGLSRLERVTPQGLARMLQTAYVSGAMPELMASLPITGVDGTLKRSKSLVSQGWAHLKSGTLRDATALAGYVHTTSGRRLVVVGIVNHPNAPAARPALEALVDWAVKEGSR
ncbi:D-alanyl-D-alanine carboxypeptidase/D-alanyl-D-alanine-endopeptidase [Polaromonas sp. CG_9.11]|uniref:D-alanyl-D-alanine carboxypeptidase/D-alanyl-D-alanine endopeptidase n=1 Tax=Polaromonas sp. CG_9.11 TaxID=2787730 RepID=UPI0018C95ABB|nr:D-alanyl-D-alanine carboxypeptidase/D-alanyl-D-alanine-endopeptidase [Polaromonas sp. CG_9.11]MBG6076614.1 D-alanyl-D-alanine carboxypeptidase/D-alanyl-D-alanine-endopeptidase (penicillin-binding protein 4) [Polaromonas sp. CG_9.11]